MNTVELKIARSEGTLKATILFSLNRLSVRVPQNFSRTSRCEPDPESVDPVARLGGPDWFYSKTTALLTISVARSIKPIVFFNNFGGPVYKTNAFLTISVARSIKPTLFKYFLGPSL